MKQTMVPVVIYLETNNAQFFLKYKIVQDNAHVLVGQNMDIHRICSLFIECTTADILVYFISWNTAI